MNKKFVFGIFTLFIFMFASCDKQDIVNVKDEIPEIVPAIDTITQYALVMSSGQIVFDSAFIETVYDSDNNIDNYSLTVSSQLINKEGYLFSAAFDPDNSAQLVEGDYKGLLSVTLSKRGIGALDEWINNGGDIEDIPDVSSEFISYDANSLIMKIFDLDGDSTKVELSGFLINEAGEKEEVNAVFKAFIR